MATPGKAPRKPRTKADKRSGAETLRVPEPTRPDIPEGYGLTEPTSAADFVPWSDVEQQLRTSRNYWICTSRPDGRPHAAPVWGVWISGRVYFSTSPASRKAKNIAANSRMVVHLESGEDAVIIEGTARNATGREELAALDKEYEAKYKITVSGHPDSMIFAVEPHKVLAWRERDFNKRATRWIFSPK